MCVCESRCLILLSISQESAQPLFPESDLIVVTTVACRACVMETRTLHTLHCLQASSSSANHEAATEGSLWDFITKKRTLKRMTAQLQLSLSANRLIRLHLKRQVRLARRTPMCSVLTLLRPDTSQLRAYPTSRPRPAHQLLWQLQHLAVREPTAASH